MAEKAAQAVDNSESEPETAPTVSVGAGKPIELTEGAPPLVLGDADAGVADVEPQSVSAAPTADDDAASVRIAHCIGNQVEQDALEQDDVAANPGLARHDAQMQALLTRRHCEGRLDPAKQAMDWEL